MIIKTLTKVAAFIFTRYLFTLIPAAAGNLYIEEGYLITFQAIEDFAKEVAGPSQLYLVQRPRFKRYANAIAVASIRPYAVGDIEKNNKYNEYNIAQEIVSTNVGVQLLANLRRRINAAIKSNSQWQFVENLGLFLGLLQRYHAEKVREGDEYEYLLGKSTQLREIKDDKERAYEASMDFLRGLFAPVVLQSANRGLDLLGLCDHKLVTVFLAKPFQPKWTNGLISSYLLNQTKHLTFCDGEALIYNFDGVNWNSEKYQPAKENIGQMVQKHRIWPKSHNQKTSDLLKKVNAFIALRADVASSIYVFADSQFGRDSEIPKMDEQYMLLNHLLSERSISVNAITIIGTDSLSISGMDGKQLLEPTQIKHFPIVLPTRNLLGLAQLSGGFHLIVPENLNTEEVKNLDNLLAEIPSLYSQSWSLITQRYVGRSRVKVEEEMEFVQHQITDILVLSTCSAKTRSQKEDVGLSLSASGEKDMHLTQLGQKGLCFYASLKADKRSRTPLTWTLRVKNPGGTVTCHVRVYGNSDQSPAATTQTNFMVPENGEVQKPITSMPALVYVSVDKETAVEAVSYSLLDLNQDESLTRQLAVSGTFEYKTRKLIKAVIDNCPGERFSLSSKLRLKSGSEVYFTFPAAFLSRSKSADIQTRESGSLCPQIVLPEKNKSSFEFHYIEKCFGALNEPLDKLDIGSLKKLDTKKPKDLCNPCLNSSNTVATASNNWTGSPLSCVISIIKPTQGPVIVERDMINCAQNQYYWAFDKDNYRRPQLSEATSAAVKCNPGLAPEECSSEEWSFTYQSETAEVHDHIGLTYEHDLLEDTIVVEKEGSNILKFSGKCCIKKFLAVSSDSVWGTFVVAHGDTGGPGRVNTAESLIWIIVGITGIVVIVLLILIIAYCIRHDSKKGDYATVAANEKQAHVRETKSTKAADL